jgi:hypothetical protein
MAVTHEQVNAILGTLEVKYHHFPDTKCVVAAAHAPDGFVWGQGWASAQPSTPFDLERGKSIALKKAMACAEDNIWEKLGFLDYVNNKEDKSEESRDAIPFLPKPLDLTDGSLKCCLFGIDGVEPQAVVGRLLHITRINAIHVYTHPLFAQYSAAEEPVRIAIHSPTHLGSYEFDLTNLKQTNLTYQSNSLMPGTSVQIRAVYNSTTSEIDLVTFIGNSRYSISKIELEGFYA